MKLNMPLNPQELEKIALRTIDHYQQRAEDYWQGTRDHDVSQNIRKLLQYINGESPFTILDFGCGPGRDLKSFRDFGHTAIGLDGAANFVTMARAYSGCEVWLQDFCKLDLPGQYFDGIFANASLFHLPSQELPRVLRELYATLKPGGVLLSSNPRGDNKEGINESRESHDQRYGTYHDLQAWQRYMTSAGFIELTHYYRPVNVPHDQQRWLASVWRKIT